jgi:putative ABC transport system permease protein
MFDLEKAIGKWRKSLRRIESFEDGEVAELESHLRDEIDFLIQSGHPQDSAFEKAVSQIGFASDLAADGHNTHSLQPTGKPSWRQNRFMPALLSNYFKITLRKIRRQKIYSLINILGLAIGMACTILIFLWVQNELSFDGYHEKSDRIYRVGSQFGPSKDQRGAFTAPPMAQAMLDELPEVLHAVRLDLWDKNIVVKRDNEYFMQEDVVWADASIFDVFTIPFIEGNSRTALVQPRSVVLTKNTAKKYFPDENPMGKTLTINARDFQITGVVDNCPQNSHFRYEMIGSLLSQKLSDDPEWDGHCYFTYIVLPEEFPPALLEAKFPEFIKKHYGPEIQSELGVSYDEYYDGKENYYGYWLQPLRDIYLLPGVGDNLAKSGNRTFISVFSLAAVFILLIACINFMNLSSAKAMSRSQEVGLRKMMGSGKSQLVRQFLSESSLLSFLSLFLAIGIVQGVLPAFNRFSGKQMQFDLFQHISAPIALFGLALLVGLISGLYPAFILSSFQPASVLKGQIKTALKSGWFRKGLVIFQFSISLVIILGTFVIFRQLKFVHNSSMGFDKDNIVVVHRAYLLGTKMETFKQELSLIPQITTISMTSSLPGRHFNDNDHRLEGNPAKQYPLFTMSADCDFAELLNLEFVKGRYFLKQIPTDATSAVVINEAAVKELGLENPVGKRFYKEFGNAKEGDFVTIIGVFEDIHFQSLHQKINPMVIRPLTGPRNNFVSIKISQEKPEATLNQIKNKWKEISGGLPFEYSFLADDLDSLYRTEQRTGQILTFFSLLALFIASLGLFGLASYTAEQRTKEIGIRKVLGSSVLGVVFLLSKEFTTLVVLANVLAWPIAYIVMNKWLQNFAYRTNLGIDMFLVSALFVFLVALLSVFYQSLKAALSNPVDSLRYE